MKKHFMIPVAAVFALGACTPTEQADDATTETEVMRDGTDTSDVMPEQPAVTDPVPGMTTPVPEGTDEQTNPDGSAPGDLRDETMTPDDKPMLNRTIDQ